MTGMLSQVDDLQLTQITDARDAPIAVHGTSKKAWETIQREVCVRFLCF